MRFQDLKKNRGCTVLWSLAVIYRDLNKGLIGRCVVIESKSSSNSLYSKNRNEFNISKKIRSNVSISRRRSGKATLTTMCS
jgi:hypothetical protein